MWDTALALHRVLVKSCSDSAKVHVGKVGGDITRMSSKDLDLSADAVIAGPPCSLVSSMGVRLGHQDSRTCPFIAVTNSILRSAVHGNLSFFIVENVRGILLRHRGAEESYAHWVINALLLKLPGGWDVKAQSPDALDCGLPFSRPRAFIIGTASGMTRTALQRKVLRTPFPVLPRLDLVHFLDDDGPTSDWDNLTMRQKINLIQQREAFEEQRLTMNPLPLVQLTHLGIRKAASIPP